jgi:hypothetical protein
MNAIASIVVVLIIVKLGAAPTTMRQTPNERMEISLSIALGKQSNKRARRDNKL